MYRKTAYSRCFKNKEAHMSISFCLMALGLGYVVLVVASKEKEGLKILGQTVGVVILLVSLLTTICCLTGSWIAKTGDGYGAKAGCPVTVSQH